MLRRSAHSRSVPVTFANLCVRHSGIRVPYPMSVVLYHPRDAHMSICSQAESAWKLKHGARYYYTVNENENPFIACGALILSASRIVAWPRLDASACHGSLLT
eukprot:scaffold95036_cov45-Prasinocladus_malaysianus.AAC.1